MPHTHNLTTTNPPLPSSVVNCIAKLLPGKLPVDSVVVDAQANPVTVDVTIATEATGADLVTLQSCVDDPIGNLPVETLDEAKERCRKDCINHRNMQFEITTFEYPAASGKMFDVGFTTWGKYNALQHVHTDTNRITYPYRVTTWDDADHYDLADAADCAAFYAAFFDTVKPEVDACRDAIVDINAAVDIPAAEAARDAYVT